MKDVCRPCSFFSVSQNFCNSVKYLSRINTLDKPSVAMSCGDGYIWWPYFAGGTSTWHPAPSRHLGTPQTKQHREHASTTARTNYPHLRPSGRQLAAEERGSSPHNPPPTAAGPTPHHVTHGHPTRRVPEPQPRLPTCTSTAERATKHTHTHTRKQKITNAFSEIVYLTREHGSLDKDAAPDPTASQQRPATNQLAPQNPHHPSLIRSMPANVIFVYDLSRKSVRL